MRTRLSSKQTIAKDLSFVKEGGELFFEGDEFEDPRWVTVVGVPDEDNVVEDTEIECVDEKGRKFTCFADQLSAKDSSGAGVDDPAYFKVAKNLRRAANGYVNQKFASVKVAFSGLLSEAIKICKDNGIKIVKPGYGTSRNECLIKDEDQKKAVKVLKDNGIIAELSRGVGHDYNYGGDLYKLSRAEGKVASRRRIAFDDDDGNWCPGCMDNVDGEIKDFSEWIEDLAEEENLSDEAVEVLENYSFNAGSKPMCYDCAHAKMESIFDESPELKNRGRKTASVKVAKKEETDKDIFTIDLFNETKADGVDTKETTKVYYDADEAIKVAEGLIKDYADEEDEYTVSVYAGEYEKPSGDIYGEVTSIWEKSNKGNKKTASVKVAAEGDAEVSPKPTGELTSEDMWSWLQKQAQYKSVVETISNEIANNAVEDVMFGRALNQNPAGGTVQNAYDWAVRLLKNQFASQIGKMRVQKDVEPVDAPEIPEIPEVEESVEVEAKTASRKRLTSK